MQSECTWISDLEITIKFHKELGILKSQQFTFGPCWLSGHFNKRSLKELLINICFASDVSDRYRKNGFVKNEIMYIGEKKHTENTNAPTQTNNGDKERS